MYGTPGTQALTTTDAIVGTSGRPIRVFSVHVVSDGTASTVILRNGTTTGGTSFIQVDGVINKGATLDFAQGILFPAGCFADVDAHTASGVVSYMEQL